jgi:hypothetical protein
MDRRSLLKGVAALGAGLLLPPTLAENVEAVTRRYWALDSTMVPSSWLHIPRGSGLWSKSGTNWSVHVAYADGKVDQYTIPAPAVGTQTDLRLRRSDTLHGVAVIDADTGILQVTYGAFPYGVLGNLR